MFTGIIQTVGVIREIDAPKLLIDVPNDVWDDPYRLGESISVNGCCLTLADFDQGLNFHLSEETLARTTLHSIQAGDRVNVERAMRPTDRFGGHIVLGHVDTIGELLSMHDEGESHVFRFEAPQGYGKYLVDKGSITIDGISLTVVRPFAGAFDVWVIPITYEHTNLSVRQPGDKVNFEFDVIAKHVERLIGVHHSG
ncbi:MAG: riboflavin synthase [Fimbriimonadaceae bacterium]|nr:riboflavin synthase [Fimbriimonadaceae bacterium]